MIFYTNDIPLEIRAFNPSQRPSGSVAVFANPSIAQIEQFYELARDGQIQGQKKLVFEVNDHERVWSAFLKRFKIIHAAGGIVRKGDEALFIYRLQKWDLPKGKLEKGESPEEASVREVEEECGIKAKRLHKIGETWHTYTDHKGQEVMKCTHWYAMECLDHSQQAPQTEEDIMELRWVNIWRDRDAVLNNTYSSIRDIFERYLQQA